MYGLVRVNQECGGDFILIFGVWQKQMEQVIENDGVMSKCKKEVCICLKLTKIESHILACIVFKCVINRLGIKRIIKILNRVCFVGHHVLS